jgi:hypothetical protein
MGSRSSLAPGCSGNLSLLMDLQDGGVLPRRSFLTQFCRFGGFVARRGRFSAGRAAPCRPLRRGRAVLSPDPCARPEPFGQPAHVRRPGTANRTTRRGAVLHRTGDRTPADGGHLPSEPRHRPARLRAICRQRSWNAERLTVSGRTASAKNRSFDEATHVPLPGGQDCRPLGDMGSPGAGLPTRLWPWPSRAIGGTHSGPCGRVGFCFEDTACRYIRKSRVPYRKRPIAPDQRWRRTTAARHSPAALARPGLSEGQRSPAHRLDARAGGCARTQPA